MKYEGKTIKYLFFAIIIGLLIFAIYIISFDNYKFATEIEEKPRKEKIKDSIYIGITNFDTINPLFTKNKDVQYLLKLVYEPLLDVSEDFKIEPKIAKEYSKLADKTYIIKLDENKVFHDGKKLTSEDVEFTISALQNTWQDSIYYDSVKNIERILIIDEYTLKIFLKEETPFFEYNLVIPILARHEYNENYELIPDKPSGTGIYYFERITSQEISLISKIAKTKRINIIVYDRSANMYSDFIRKNVDVITSSNTNYERYIGTIGYKSVKVPGRNFKYIQISQNNFLLKDATLRKAINMAINKKEIIYTVYNNKSLELEFPDLNLLNTEMIEYNPNEAAKILDEAGYKLKEESLYKNGKRVVLRLNVIGENDDEIKVAEMIKDNLKDIGITINILKLSKQNYEYNLKNNYYDLCLCNQLIYLEPNYNSYFKQSSNETRELLKEIEKVDNEETKKEKIDNLIEQGKEELPFIGLFVDSTALLINQDLKGNLGANWYNIFYNIETWYKVEK